jgi:hypothetical protein
MARSVIAGRAQDARLHAVSITKSRTIFVYPIINNAEGVRLNV